MSKYDEFDEPNSSVLARMASLFERRRPIEPRKPTFALSVVGALVVLLGTVLWMSYPRGPHGLNGEVPIIRADATPVKVAPDSQGGMDIPFRESTVFDSMRGETPDGKVENLLPQMERPVDRNQVFAALKTAPAQGAAANAPMDLTAKIANIEPAENASTAPAPTKTIQVGGATGFAPAATPSSPTNSGAPAKTDAPAVATEPPVDETQGSTNGAVATATPTPKPAALTPAAKNAGAPVAVKKPVASNVKTGGDYIQLAAIKDRASAPAVWSGLQKRFPSQLGSQSYRIGQAVVKGNHFFRVQAGPMSGDAAHAACKSINSTKPGACLVVSD
jgi:hypothetical protein